MSSLDFPEANIYQQPLNLLRRLIQFDTTNPPGNETACLEYISQLLASNGIDSSILAKEPDRPNLIARLPGRGQAPPLLFYGHVDVVTTAQQEWTYPPFEAKVADGYLWGRGALDMKSGVAMMLSAILRAKANGIRPAGDVLLATLADEEGAGDFGARYLVESHAELFEGVRYAIGESGGKTKHYGGQRFYPIMVGEKQLCWMIATIRGPGGHGARPMRGGSMAKLGRVLGQLDRHRLPVHVTPITRQMIETMAEACPLEQKVQMAQLLNNRQTDETLDRLGVTGQYYDPLLHNTVNATIVNGGNKANVIPSEISLQLDGRLLPGYEPDDLIAELTTLIGQDINLDVYRHDPGPAEPDMGLFDLLGDILVEADPGSVPMPLLLAGVTDGRYFSRLGIQTYGFLPMKLDSNFNPDKLIHAADERIPVEAVEFGTDALYQLIRRYQG